MALYRIIRLLVLHRRGQDAPITGELLWCLAAQMLVFALMLGLFFLATYIRPSADLARQSMGFGCGWLAFVRWYVWKFVG